MNKRIDTILINNEFTLVNLIKLIKAKIQLLIAVVVLFIALGLTYYVTTPNSYQASTVLLVEAQNTAQTGGLGSLAQVAGISMPGNAAELNTLDPALYPLILQSKPFLVELMYSKVKSEMYADSVTLYKYMVEVRPENSITKSLKRPKSIFSSGSQVQNFPSDSITKNARIQYEPLEMYALGQIAQRIAASSEGRLLTINTEMPEAELSFQFSHLVESYLIEYATKYLIEKQENHVEYLQGQYLTIEKGFKDAQAELARFKERNQGLYSESLKAHEQNLNSDYNLKFDLFRTVAQEMEMAKIKLNSQKPIFSAIEPGFIPNKPASPRLVLTLAFSMVLGFIVGLIMIFAVYIKRYLSLHQDETS